jgi:hypothetical protein
MDRYGHMKTKHKTAETKRIGLVGEGNKPVVSVDLLACTLCLKVFPDDVAMIAHWNVDHM